MSISSDNLAENYLHDSLIENDNLINNYLYDSVVEWENLIANGNYFDDDQPSLHHPTLTSFSCDSRSASVAPLRDRTHRKKYRFRTGAQPIPYTTALNTPTPALSPSLVMWSTFWSDKRWRSILDPPNQPSESTLRANRRRVFEAARSTESFDNSRKRCSCSWCRYTRRKISRRATQEHVKEIREAECDAQGLEELVEELVEREWLYSNDLELQKCSEDGQQVVELSEGDGPVVDKRWAKLVDDAVGVWEGKRRHWVERLGWEVCSEHDHCPSLSRLSRPESASRSSSCSREEWTKLDSIGDYDDNCGGENGENICRAGHAIVDVDSDDGWDAMSIGP